MGRLAVRFRIRHLYPVLPIALFTVIASGEIRDNSFLWHVRAGSVQLLSTHVLTTDPFSYMVGGEPWRTQSWLMELAYARAESLFSGLGWVPVMVAIIGVGILGVTGITIYARTGSTISVAMWLIVVVWLLAPFAQPRPVIGSYLLLSLLVLVLSLEERAEWAVIPLLWMWAGIHGSWIIGVGLVVLVSLQRRSARLLAIGGVAAAMTGLTAHGLGTWGTLVSFARNAGALDYLQEWQPPDFGDVAQFPYLLIMAGILIAGVKGKIKTSELWVVLPLLAFGFTSKRAVPVAALVLAPIAARWVTIRLPKTADGKAAIPLAALALVVALTGIVVSTSDHQLSTEVFPSDAAIDAVGDGRFFHDDGVGGYLIYRYGPERQMYIDDRAELYGAEAYAEFRRARDGDYEALFERLGMGAAIVKPTWPLRAILMRDGWLTEYADGDFVVLRDPNWRTYLQASHRRIEAGRGRTKNGCATLR